jgi:transcriptional regulator with XRE-family HTH domain
MVDRILDLMKQKNFTPSQFADEIGIQRSGMSHLLSGRNKPSLEFIMKILKRFPEVKADWLLYGKTEFEVESNSPTVKPKVQGTTLFDLQEETVEVKHEEPAPRMQRKEKAEKKVERIIIFYDDRSFREYKPEG